MAGRNMPRISDLRFYPDPVPLQEAPGRSTSEFEFSYVEEPSGKKRRYRVRRRGEDKESFASYVFALLKARRKNWIDWPSMGAIKVDVENTEKAKSAMARRIVEGYLTV